MSHPKPHVLLVSQQAYGHLNPTIQLANNLVRAGARVTLATTVSGLYKLKSLPSVNGLSFASFSDGHDDDILAFMNLGYFHDIKRVGSETLGSLIRSLSESGDTVTFLVYTLFLPWAAAVARELSVPSALLVIQSATTFAICERFCNSRDGILVANKVIDTEMLLKLPGLPSFTYGDLPTFLLPSPYQPGIVSAFKEHLQFLAEDPNPCVLVNTLEGMELDSIKYIPNAIIVGPLVPNSSSGEDRASYFRWLDSKPEKSVVYASFGSIAVLKKTQKEELLHGLIESGRPFFLVLRDNEEDEEDDIKELKKTIGDNGMIVGWCSQSEVLRHDAIGCFVTHCGWNSTLDSLVAGVAVVGCPQLAEQTTNAKMVEEVWGNGVKAAVDEAMVVRR